jgi:hypothetical protein
MTMDLPEIQWVAGCEHSTETALRAALYCAIGIAMQAREDATGAMDAAEADRRGARAESEHIRGERDAAIAESALHRDIAAGAVRERDETSATCGRGSPSAGRVKRSCTPPFYPARYEIPPKPTTHRWSIIIPLAP